MTRLDLIVVLWLGVFHLSGAHLPIRAEASDSSEDILDSRSCASLNCNEERARPVCGSDGLTYNSQCDLRRAQCMGHKVVLMNRGRCAVEKKCFAERAKADALQGTDANVVVPECTSDGRFKRRQCHKATGYCWCVTPEGKRQYKSGSSKQHLDCRRKGKTSANRRSSGSRRRRRACSQTDRSTFNGNLIKSFTSEYTRMSGMPAEHRRSSLDKEVTDWKFSQLDANGDSKLQRAEYRELRSLVRKVVKPRRCARSFARICDANGDRVISRQEWVTCLGVGVNFDSRGGRDKDEEDDDDEDSEASQPSGFNFHRPLSGSLLGPSSSQETSPFRSGPSLTHQDMGGFRGFGTAGRSPTRGNGNSRNGANCSHERQIALDGWRQDFMSHERQPSANGSYIPQCTPDGKYQRLQCFWGYCWCVNEETGIMTTSKVYPSNIRLNCDRLAKGCIDKKREKFLEGLIDYMNKSMTSSISGSDSLPAAALTKEKVVRWQFGQLDRNGNQVLERNEWKVFRRTVAAQEHLKKCGKKLPGLCDLNQDKKITLEEWLQCLDANAGPPAKKRGKNPLEIFLKAK